MDAHIQTIQLKLFGSKYEINEFIYWLREVSRKSTDNVISDDVESVKRNQDKLGDIADQIERQL